MIENTNLNNDMAHPFSRRNMIMPPATSAQINEAEGTELKTYTVTVDGTEITEDMNLETDKIMPYMDMPASSSSVYAKKGNTLYTATRTSSEVKIVVYTDGSTKSETHSITTSTTGTRFSIFTYGNKLCIADNDKFYEVDLEHNTMSQISSTTVPYDASDSENYDVTATRYFEVADGVIGCNYLMGDVYRIAISSNLSTWIQYTDSAAEDPDDPAITLPSKALVSNNKGYFLDNTTDTCYIFMIEASGGLTYFGYYGLKITDSTMSAVLNKTTVAGGSVATATFANITKVGNVLYAIGYATSSLRLTCITYDTSAASSTVKFDNNSSYSYNFTQFAVAHSGKVLIGYAGLPALIEQKSNAIEVTYLELDTLTEV